MPVKAKSAMYVPCPTCKAPAGSPCAGTETGAVHALRLRDSLIARLKDKT